MDQVVGTIYLDFTAGPTPGTLTCSLSLVDAQGITHDSEAPVPVKVGDQLSYGPVTAVYTGGPVLTAGAPASAGAKPAPGGAPGAPPKPSPGAPNTRGS